MKNLFYLIVIISLPIILFFQYRNYQRFHAPSAYHLEANPEVDPNYYKPESLLKYHQLLKEAESYAGYLWRKHRIDVKSTNPSSTEHQDKYQTYQQYLSTAKFLEAKLVQSSRLKKEGYSNEEIMAIENGKSDHSLNKFLNNKIQAQKGDENALVYEVQRRLTKLGIEMPVDGVFSVETEAGLITFQQQNEIYSSGMIDDITLSLLFKEN